MPHSVTCDFPPPSDHANQPPAHPNLQTKAILGTSIIGHLLGARICQRPRKEGEIMTYHDEKKQLEVDLFEIES